MREMIDKKDLEEKNKHIIPMPERSNAGQECDTFKGPCACGAWHNPDLIIIESSLPTYQVLEEEEIVNKIRDEVVENEFCRCVGCDRKILSLASQLKPKEIKR